MHLFFFSVKSADIGMIRFCVFGFLLFFHLLQLVSPAKCPTSFDCGNHSRMEFPFTTTERPDCGELAVRGCQDSDPRANKTIEMVGRPFVVTNIYPNKTVIRDKQLHNYLKSQKCEAFINNITLPPSSSLASYEIEKYITIFRCSHTLNVSLPKSFSNYSNCSNYNIIYSRTNTDNSMGSGYPRSLAACSTIQLPFRDLTDSDDPFTFLTAEFAIQARSDDCEKCHLHGGRCQLDNGRNFDCSKEKTRRLVPLVSTATTTIGMVVVAMMILVWCLKGRYFFLHFFTCKGRKNSTNQIIENFLKEHGHLPTQRYTYSEVKETTNSFKNKLGQGGYGSVFKGKLRDGREVAVKVLSELKGDGEEFINEVASISRTSHVNIVSLLGFCFQGSKRALIYEFMSNGSLEKFIYEENAKMTNHQLDCVTLYNIAIGIARGLEYLHRGCNTKILHMDIKPHNILLDKDFSPKISDFGLTKICERQESFVSIFGARGIAGYIAPEVFYRNFGGVSHKSNVYSYGMMILEMVRGRKNINVKVDCSSEIYFPHWVYKRVDLNQEFELWCTRNEMDKEKAKKMIVVGLWCIQTNPRNWPAMTKVIEMLEGSIDCLEVPPKPFLTSPSLSPSHNC